jgi:hypothetical protein
MPTFGAPAIAVDPSSSTPAAIRNVVDLFIYASFDVVVHEKAGMRATQIAMKMPAVGLGVYPIAGPTDEKRRPWLSFCRKTLVG